MVGNINGCGNDQDGQGHCGHTNGKAVDDIGCRPRLGGAGNSLNRLIIGRGIVFSGNPHRRSRNQTGDNGVKGSQIPQDTPGQEEGSNGHNDTAGKGPVAQGCMGVGPFTGPDKEGGYNGGQDPN